MCRIEVALLFLLVVSITTGQGSTCEPFAGNPPACAHLIDYNVWIPPNLTQAVLATDLSQSIALISLLPGDCARATLRSACSQAFRMCSKDELPLPLCSEECHAINKVCTTPINCSAADPFLGERFPLWASDSCAYANKSSVVTLDCPYPYTFNPIRDECNMKCPPTSLDNANEQYTLWVTSWVLSVLSLVGCLLHIPPLALQHRASTRDGYALWWFVCQVIGNLGILCGRWTPWREFLCTDPWTLRTGDSFYCGVSAVLNYNGYLGSTLWIVFMLYKILVGITQNKCALFGPTAPISFVSENTALHIIGWVPHLILTVILLANGWFTSTSGYTCEVDSSRKWVFYGMLILPLTIYAFLTIILCIAVLFVVLRFGVTALVSQWRIVALSVYYTFIVVTVLVISYYGQEKSDETRAAIGAYVVCAAKIGYKSCTYNAPVAWALTYTSIVLVVSVGFFMSILFWNRSTLNAWRYIIGQATGLFSVTDWRSDVETSASVSHDM